MYIRELDKDEFWTCQRFGEAFHQEKALPDQFNLDAFIKNWTLFYQTEKGIIYGLFDDGHQLIGGIGGILSDDLTSGIKTISELFWYVDKSKRHTTGRWPLRLVTRLREWGKDRGAKRFRMVHILMPGENAADVQLADIYTHVLKLRPIEVGFDGEIED